MRTETTRTETPPTHAPSQHAAPPAAGEGLTLGAFAVQRPGVLRPRQPGVHPTLRFAWRGRPCQVQLHAAALRLAALAGRVPSTADPGADRAGALAALAALPEAMPQGWTLRLLPDHRISVEATTALDGPPTAVGLVARMVRFALALDPYLDTLEAAGADAPGTAKTWPG
jgi:hypothetical protein